MNDDYSMYTICPDCKHSMSMHIGVVDMGGGHSEPLGCTHNVKKARKTVVGVPDNLHGGVPPEVLNPHNVEISTTIEMCDCLKLRGHPMNDYKATIKEILGTFVYHYGIEANHPAGDLVEPYDEATATLLQLLNEARIDTLNKVREQANGSYEIRTPKEPENMIWEIAEWQLKDIEDELNEGIGQNE